MDDFQFITSDEVAGFWDLAECPEWRTGPGDNFFLATWSEGDVKLGWFGIYHEALGDLESRAREFTENDSSWLDEPDKWGQLANLSAKTPGWGLMRLSAAGLTLWRDPVGRLPIFFRRNNDSIEWATRPRELRSFQWRIKHSRLRQFVNRDDRDSRSEFFEGVWRLRAGERLLKRRLPRGKAPQITSWWPRVAGKDDSKYEVEQRVGDLLSASLDRVLERGARTISLSAGVDSSLLLALMVEKGAETRPVSMVDPTTEFFDESEDIRLLLEHLGVDGHFVDIGGPLNWPNLEVHHPVVDFGPSSHPGAAYETSIFEGELRPAENLIITGLGADQLFYCRRSHYFQDRLHENLGWEEAIQAGKWRILAKEVLSKIGLETVPLKRMTTTTSPWVNDSRIAPASRKSVLYRRINWILNRTEIFRGWTWEYSMRLLERYRRRTDLLYLNPYLSPSLIEFAWCLPPSILRSHQRSKLPLRVLLDRRVPPRIAMRSKRGLFTEIVWRGLRENMGVSLDQLISTTYLEESAYFETDVVQTIMLGLDDETESRPGLSVDIWRIVASALWLKLQET